MPRGEPKRKKSGDIIFPDYPDFTPNLTPREMFLLGSFGGTYWRPIYSSVTKKSYNAMHKKYPARWWRGIPDEYLTTPWEEYRVSINKYKVRVGTTLEFWESKKWIDKQNPYGWVQWYCDFYMGKRGPDDHRQVERWKKTAGPNSRFRRRLINMVKAARTTYSDLSISPKIRQTLQHWAYRLTSRDCK